MNGIQQCIKWGKGRTNQHIQHNHTQTQEVIFSCCFYYFNNIKEKRKVFHSFLCAKAKAMRKKRNKKKKQNEKTIERNHIKLNFLSYLFVSI